MTKQEIEARVGDLAERVKNGILIEDDRIELKLQWMPNPNEAARRIAGHANQARAEWILWIIGMNDSNRKIATPQPPVDPADWWAQVESEFESKIAPRANFLQIPVGKEMVTAILFETERAPYVVRNAVSGSPGGGPVKWEVPWREGTATRTANRLDLLRILLPVSKLPHIDVLEAHLRRHSQTAGHLVFESILYLTPTTRELVTIPDHLVTITAAWHTAEGPPVALAVTSRQLKTATGFVRDQLDFERPDKFEILAVISMEREFVPQDTGTQIEVVMDFGFPQHRPHKVRIPSHFRYSQDAEVLSGRWQWDKIS